MPSDAKKKAAAKKKAQGAARGKKEAKTEEVDLDEQDEPTSGTATPNGKDSDGENGVDGADGGEGVPKAAKPKAQAGDGPKASLAQASTTADDSEFQDASGAPSVTRPKSKDGLADLNITARNTTGVLTSHPRGRDSQVSNFSLTFHGVRLFEDANLELNHGRRYGLLGPNGCGKSTMLEALAGSCGWFGERKGRIIGEYVHVTVEIIQHT